MISIHAPLRGVRRCRPVCICRCGKNFNPRTPARGATQSLAFCFHCTNDFNPRTPARGATSNSRAAIRRDSHFNPRTPARGATRLWWLGVKIDAISIHAPLRGVRRVTSLYTVTVPKDFNPRTPARGATRHRQLLRVWSNNFNPRTPARGAT